MPHTGEFMLMAAERWERHQSTQRMSRCHVLGNQYCLLDCLGFRSTHIFNQPFEQHLDWRGQTTAEPLHQ